MTNTQRPRQPCILVTGAGGFVGRWLIRALLLRVSSSTRIVAGTLDDFEFEPQVEQRKLNIVDREQVNFVIRDTRPTCVIHLAAVTDIFSAQKSPDKAWAVNFKGTMHLANSVLEHAPDARFLYISSSEVYGETFERWGRPLNEEAPLAPTNRYGATKAAADILVGQLAHEGLKSIRFRPFNHTGPGQTPKFAIPAFAMQIVRIERGLQEPILRVGNLNVERNFLDVRDVVDAYVRAVFAADEIAAGHIFNIASNVSRRMSDIVAELLARARVSIQVESQNELHRADESSVKMGDASRARAVLGWSPQVPWDTTLDDILNECRVRGERA